MYHTDSKIWWEVKICHPMMKHQNVHDASRQTCNPKNRHVGNRGQFSQLCCWISNTVLIIDDWEPVLMVAVCLNVIFVQLAVFWM